METTMRKIMMRGTMLIALMTAVSCTETETGIGPEPDEGGQVALGVAANLKVDAGTKAATKSIVSGSKISYTDYDAAPGLGVLVTNNNASGWYSSDGDDSWHHVWYMGDEKGANWISIQTKGDSFKNTKEAPYYLKKDIGKVYAYYPYDKDLEKSLSTISSEDDLKIPVTVLATGTIDATTNNAKKYWSIDTWEPTSKINQVNLSLSAEKDYLYFAAAEGRNVNNGRATGQTPVTPDDEPNNNNTDNPGYKINLDMKHAMAMVSFRVYDGGHLSDNDVTFSKFEIKNHSGSSLLKTGSRSMSLVDGTISGAGTTSGIDRTITNYVLMRQMEEGGKEGEHAFIFTGSTSSSINGQSVSKTVSAIVYPTTFSDDNIDVEITLTEDGKATVYPVALPGNEWLAGTNCIYTFSAGRNKLTVVEVSVEDWEEDPQAEIPL